MNACVVFSLESGVRFTCYKSTSDKVHVDLMFENGGYRVIELNVSDATMIGATLIALANDESDGE